MTSVLMKDVKMGWRMHHVLWRLTMKSFTMKLGDWWHHLIEWHIKSRFGFGLWRRTRYLRLVPKVRDNQPIWVLCQHEKRFIGWKNVEIATGATPEELVPLADHRMQAAKFLRKKDGKFTFEPKTAGEEGLTWMVNVLYSASDKKTFFFDGKWEQADADDVRPESADSRATEADREVPHGTEAPAPTGTGEGERGSAPEAEAQCSRSEGEAKEVSADGAGVLEGRDR